jgi:hypothetical protein
MAATTTTTQVHTFLISAIGLQGGETLHYNGHELDVITADASAPGRYMRVYYVTPEFGMDWIVLRKTEMVVVS